jgi:hypothetical protein
MDYQHRGIGGGTADPPAAGFFQVTSPVAIHYLIAPTT